MKVALGSYILLMLLALSPAVAFAQQESSSDAPTGNAFWPEPRRAQIWSLITVHEGADLHQLQETMAQTRDEVRDKLWNQLSDLAPQLMTSMTDGAKLARSLAGILMSFDRVHSMHKAEDKINYDRTLSVQLQSGFERFMRTHHIPDSMRRAEFITPSASALNFLLQPSTERSNISLVHPAVTTPPPGIDYVIALTWSGTGSTVQIGLSVERVIATPLPNGSLEVITKPVLVTISGPWATAGDQAGYELARMFQALDPVAPTNPNPVGLKWITHFVEDFAQPMSHTEAARICRSQNARLPYADELLLAEKMNEFFPGGLNQLSETAYFAVADKQREEGQSYFLNKSFASSPTGMVVSEAALGPLTGYVFCVIGEPAASIRTTQLAFELIRKARAFGHSKVVDVLEYLLIRAGEMGHVPVESLYARQLQAKFGTQSSNEIARWLKAKGYPIDIGPWGL